VFTDTAAHVVGQVAYASHNGPIYCSGSTSSMPTIVVQPGIQYAVTGCGASFSGVAQAAGTGASTGGTGSTAGTGGTGGTGATGGSGYISWNGSSNGDVVLDGNGTVYRVQASDRKVADASGVAFTGTYVDASANLSISGTAVGYVGLAPAVQGGQVAVFNCNDGSRLYFDASAASYSWHCGAGSSGGSSGSFSDNETSEINATLTGSAPNYVSTSGLTLTTTTKVWAYTWAQYTSNFWVVDAANAQRINNGQSFSGYQIGSNGNIGLYYVTLPAGTWYVAAIPNQSVFQGYSNPIYAELSRPSLDGAVEVSNIPLGTGVKNPGGWVVQPFTISGSARAWIETEGNGGTFMVMTSAQAAAFQAQYPSGFTGGTYSYVYACGPNSGAASLEIECELSLSPGNYALVYVNTTSSPSGGAANIGFFQ
jgi:hypothetical protein